MYLRRLQPATEIGEDSLLQELGSNLKARVAVGGITEERLEEELMALRRQADEDFNSHNADQDSEQDQAETMALGAKGGKGARSQLRLPMADEQLLELLDDARDYCEANYGSVQVFRLDGQFG